MALTEDLRNPPTAACQQLLICLINLIINHLTDQGFMDAARLYESPFTDLNPKGVEGVFAPDQVGRLLGILNNIRSQAAAA